MANFAFVENQKAIVNLDNVDLIELTEYNSKFHVVFFKMLIGTDSPIKVTIGSWSFDSDSQRVSSLSSIKSSNNGANYGYSSDVAVF